MILFGGEEHIEGILEELELTSSTNGKIALLKQHKNNTTHNDSVVLTSITKKE